MRRYVQALNEFYTRTPALYEIDDGWDGFAWLNVNNAKQSAVSFLGVARARKRSACAPSTLRRCRWSGL